MPEGVIVEETAHPGHAAILAMVRLEIPAAIPAAILATAHVAAHLAGNAGQLKLERRQEMEDRR